MSGMFRAGDEIMTVDGVELNGKTLLESKRLFLGLEGTMVQLRCVCMAVSECGQDLMRGCDMLILLFLPLCAKTHSSAYLIRMLFMPMGVWLCLFLLTSIIPVRICHGYLQHTSSETSPRCSSCARFSSWLRLLLFSAAFCGHRLGKNFRSASVAMSSLVMLAPKSECEGEQGERLEFTCILTSMSVTGRLGGNQLRS